MTGDRTPARPTRPARPGREREPSKSKRNAATRRRQREEPLQTWRKQLVDVDNEVRELLNIGPGDLIPQDQMVTETLLLADARSYRHLDAVVPAGRLDVAQTWIDARLGGAGSTPDQRRVLAETVAPPPDADLIPYTDPKTGRTRYRGEDPFRKQVEKALRSYLDRQARANDVGDSTSR